MTHKWSKMHLNCFQVEDPVFPHSHKRLSYTCASFWISAHLLMVSQTLDCIPSSVTGWKGGWLSCPLPSWQRLQASPSHPITTLSCYRPQDRRPFTQTDRTIVTLNLSEQTIFPPTAVIKNTFHNLLPTSTATATTDSLIVSSPSGKL